MNAVENATYCLAVHKFLSAMPKEIEPTTPQQFRVVSATCLTTAVVTRLVAEGSPIEWSEDLAEHLNAKAAAWIKKKRAATTEAN